MLTAQTNFVRNIFELGLLSYGRMQSDNGAGLGSPSLIYVITILS